MVNTYRLVRFTNQSRRTSLFCNEEEIVEPNVPIEWGPPPNNDLGLHIYGVILTAWIILKNEYGVAVADLFCEEFAKYLSTITSPTLTLGSNLIAFLLNNTFYVPI